jgi:hypothetical protein
VSWTVSGRKRRTRRWKVRRNNAFVFIIRLSTSNRAKHSLRMMRSPHLQLRGGHAVDERGWLGFGRVGFLRMYREQPRCIRGALGHTAVNAVDSVRVACAAPSAGAALEAGVCFATVEAMRVAERHATTVFGSVVDMAHGLRDVVGGAASLDDAQVCAATPSLLPPVAQEAKRVEIKTQHPQAVQGAPRCHTAHSTGANPPASPPVAQLHG